MMNPTFAAIAARLETHVAAGHRQNQSEILEALDELSRDYTALREFIRLAAEEPERRNLFGAQSFLLYTGPTFLMRLNLWFPHSEHVPAAAAARYERFLSIDICHNHNFDFFTVGLFGEGYRSRYLHSSEDLTRKAEGERIEFDDQWEVQVPRGRSMFVRRSEDFHIQYCPDEFSMTLNVIPHAGRDPGGRQFVVEEGSWRIQHVLLSGLEAERPDPGLTERLHDYARRAGIDLSAQPSRSGAGQVDLRP